MLIDLVITVCLAATGGECHNEHLLLEFSGSQRQCLAASPVYIAQWSASHPQWRVTRWTCLPAGSATDESI